jgi:tRNA 2-selenouridine synthase SelU
MLKIIGGVSNILTFVSKLIEISQEFLEFKHTGRHTHGRRDFSSFALSKELMPIINRKETKDTLFLILRLLQTLSCISCEDKNDEKERKREKKKKNKEGIRK